MKHEVYEAEIPKNSSYAKYISDVNYSNAYRVKLQNLELSIEKNHNNVFSHVPNWIMKLMAFRNKMVSIFGLKTDAVLNDKKSLKVGEKFGIFKIYSIQEDEIIAGEDDKYLNFRVSILKQDEELIISTFVHYNNLFGKVYMALITPFHKLVVKAMMKNAIKRENHGI